MRLWLDDVRNPQQLGLKRDWTWAKTAGEAIQLLEMFEVAQASLDYDIAWDIGATDENWEDTRTGYAVAKWMADNNSWPPEGVYIHSSNLEGAARMRAVLGEHYREGRAAA